MNKIVVINADDLGFSKGTNSGIEKAHRYGLLTSASIMPTGPAYVESLRLVKRNPRLGIGVHLSLTLGRSLLSKESIPDLVDRQGYFYANSVFLLLKTIFKPSVRRQIHRELDAQVKKVLRDGIKVDHLDSQYHVHSMPTIFPIVESIAKQYGIPFVRFPVESLFTIPLSVSFLKWALVKLFSLVLYMKGYGRAFYPVFYGILFTRDMGLNVVKTVLKRKDTGVVEVLLHPGEFDLGQTSFDFHRQHIIPFLASQNRVMELNVLCSAELKAFIKARKIQLMTFGGAANMLNAQLH